MASLGLPAFESPAPKPNKDALFRILESVVTTNERLAGQDDKISQTARLPPAVSTAVTAAPRFSSASAAWQEAEHPDMYDVDVPQRPTSSDDKTFSGLFSSGAFATDLALRLRIKSSTHLIFSSRGGHNLHVNRIVRMSDYHTSAIAQSSNQTTYVNLHLPRVSVISSRIFAAAVALGLITVSPTLLRKHTN